MRLTTPEERRRIRAIVESYVDPLTDDDLAVLGYSVYAAGLEAGVAAHHAGMVPPFREAVEACFAEALVKVVFATETLALGINMPARSVVIEEVTKFGGRGHQELTPGEYTQLTGRAGRRGIDDVGYAAVLCSPFHTFGDVARIAGGRPRALSSSFRPTYNLAVNLVRRHSRETAYRLVSSSFAQFLSDEDLVGELDSVLGVLERRSYIDGWTVTEAGARLAGLYHEADLLVAEALEAGHLDGLDPASLAAVASGLCYEARRERGSAACAEPQGRHAPRSDRAALGGAVGRGDEGTPAADTRCGLRIRVAHLRMGEGARPPPGPAAGHRPGPTRPEGGTAHVGRRLRPQREAGHRPSPASCDGRCPA